MREKQAARVREIVGRSLTDGEVVELTVQSLFAPVPAHQGKVAATAGRASLLLSPRKAVRQEGFVALTSERIVCLGKNPAGRPTSTLRATLLREDIARVEYQRSVLSTIRIWPRGERDGIALTFGRMLRGQADALHAALDGVRA